MKQSKHYIEGVAAAHAGSIRACRYNTSSFRADWLAGFDSVDRSHVVFKVSSLLDSVSVEDLDPVFVGRLTQCLDRFETLRLSDRAGRYVIYISETGKPYQYSGLGDAK